MRTHEIRRRFLEYFKSKGHSIIPSSPVFPHDDPTLLFTNAGMNQFKDVFLGKSIRDYKRVATSQKCIRAGGKHNDLDNVGHTKRHLTFFEMLGNFSFGDYFKEQAIEFAWEVSTTVFQFDPNRIWPTVFRDDDEAFEIWTRFVPQERISRLGEKDNFWAMGETGPCGPCSELLYDRGPKFGSANSPLEDTSGERFLEFWNLVFMQFNRTPSGEQLPLPKPSIDTGAGLERVMALIQDKENVFETDLLRGLIARVEEVSGKAYDHCDAKTAPAFRVIADHLRCLSFAIADGAQPSNVERGYVLRKILRRAVRYGRQLGFEGPFLAHILPQLITEMGQDYPELVQSQSRIAEVLTLEEEAFFRTLRRGGNILSQIIERSMQHGKQISGDDAFRLKDTYGFPLEEVLLIAKDSDLSVDTARFEVLEKESKEKSRSSHKQAHQTAEKSLYEDFLAQHGECRFVRDSHGELESTVIGIVKDGQLATELHSGQEGLVILKETPFYAEMGGQLGDSGAISTQEAMFQVTDCQSPFKGIIVHKGLVKQGRLCIDDTIHAKIDSQKRQKIENNHTATHLLHWALHTVLGEHIKQAGSIVDANRLRFDFSHHKSLTDEEVRKIESLINEKIRLNLPVKAYELKYEEAQKRADIKQFFGDKYGSEVRVIDIDFSKELCGGTHTSYTGKIGYFRIAKESSIAAGVRRIEAVTGQDAEQLCYETEDSLKKIAELLKVPVPKASEKIEKLNEEVKQLQAELKVIKKQQLESLIQSINETKTSSQGIAYSIHELPVKADELKTLAQDLTNRLKSCVIALGCKDNGKAYLVIRVTPDLHSKGIRAQSLLQAVLPLIGGNGGGKDDFAQGAGSNLDALSNALEQLVSRL